MTVPPIYAAMTARRLFSHVDLPALSLSSYSDSFHPKVHKELYRHGLRLRDDGYVEWRNYDPQRPRNWSISKKAYNNILLCFFEFWMTAMSSAGTAASEGAHIDFGISRTTGFFVFTSIYLFGQAAGSVFCSPLSEAFGRRNLYITSIGVYCVFSSVVGFAPSGVSAAFARFITGTVSAIPAIVAFGTFEDMHSSETRKWIVFVYTLAGNCGLVLGPIYSAYVSTYMTWRFVFFISTIITSIGLLASIFLHETSTIYLLERKIKKVQKRVGDQGLRIPDKKRIPLTEFATESLLRPLEFLFTEPIVICCAVLMALSFSLTYGLTEGLLVVYYELGFSGPTASLAFLPLLLGLIINIVPRVYEQQVFDQNRDQSIPTRAETNARSLLISCPSLAFGLWLFAWTIPPQVSNVPWIISMAGLVFIGYATNDFACVFFGYLTDCYGKNAPSACAALSLSRTLMAAIFPLFTYTMYTELGGNVSTSIFAAIATLFCATPVLFIKYGRQMRKLSRFADTDGDDIVTESFSDDYKASGAIQA